MEELEKIALADKKEKMNAFSGDTFKGENEDLKNFSQRFSKIVEKLEQENKDANVDNQCFNENYLSECQRSYNEQQFAPEVNELSLVPLEDNKDSYNSNVLQTPNYDYISAVESGKRARTKAKSMRKKRFRVKLVCSFYVLTLALVTGWVIGNAISINNTASAINSTKYEINEIQLIIKEAQLDSFQDVQNGKESLITSIVDIEAPKLAKPTEVQPQTNIFDKICNWIQSIFA